jgi:O-antigen ligase
MWVSINMAKNNDVLFEKALFTFVISIAILTIMYVFNIQVEESIENRITVMGNNQNDLGIRLCIAILIIYIFIKEKILYLQKKKILLIIIAIFMFSFLVNTASKSGILSLVIGLMTYTILKKHNIFINKIISIIFFVIGIIFLWQYVIKDSYVGERLLQFFYENDLSDRDVRWLATWQTIKQGNYILGMGQTGFYKSITAILGFYSSPHNVFIEILAYAGICGTFFFLWFFIRVFISSITNYRHHNDIIGVILMTSILMTML